MLKVNTYNDKRKARYGKKYFIGCEDMVVKQIRACKVEYVHVICDVLQNAMESKAMKTYLTCLMTDAFLMMSS